MGAQLVILAAGVGRRFGGLKQLTPVGPNGEALLDYTVHDARRSGFDEIILVIRRETEARMLAHLADGPGRDGKVTVVFQDREPLPPERTKPWGTCHAVLAAAEVIDGPFAVANADDYYGAPAIAAVGAFLAGPAMTPAATPPTWAMAGFRVADTLPASGAVSRGLVTADRGFLSRIDEVHTVSRHPDGAVWEAPEGPRVIPGSSLVSMNLWGFTVEALADLAERFDRFLAADPGPDAECYLPECVGAAFRERVARVAVLPVASRWCGMTAAADLPRVERVMADLVAAGAYPEHLWTR